MLASALEFLSARDVTFVAQWDLRWLYPIKALCVFAVLLWCWRHCSELRSLAAVDVRGWVTAVAVGAVVFVVWIALNQSWASLGESGGFNPTDAATGSVDWMLVALRLFGAALVVPVVEELFWRSFLMRWLQNHDFLSVAPGAVGVRAFVLTAVLFAVEHNLWLAGLLAGAAYAGLYMWSRNLWVPVIAHAVTNGMLGAWVLQTRQWDLW